MALSPLQEGLYSLTTLAEFADGQPADDPYVIGMAADITGTLDVALLRDCAERCWCVTRTCGPASFPRHPAAGANRAVPGRAAVAVRHGLAR